MAEERATETQVSWHALPVEEVLQRLETSRDGLDSQEVPRRLEQYGRNHLKPPQPMSPLWRFLLHFHNVVIYVLIVAAVVAGILGHWVDTAVIAAVVVINALIGYIQEGKAERALEAVRNMLSPKAVVLRGGQRQTIEGEEVVPGDIVLLEAGDRVPADLRLFKVKDLRINESMLTGESEPAEKSTDPVEETAGLGDRHGLAFSSAMVTSGQGRGVVISTGDHTEIGRISGMLAGVEQLTTPLLEQISGLGKAISAAVAVGATAMFAFGMLVRSYSAGDMFMAAVGMVVAAIPEGLPAIITITLAIGVQRMARRNAIIRKLPAVDTLGSVTVICCDKTGTLTRNEMMVQALVTPDHPFLEVTGGGYAPEGEFRLEGQQVSPEEDAAVLEMLRGGLLCNDARAAQDDGQWNSEGDPTETALVTVAMKAGLDQEGERNAWPRLDEVPFASEYRFMATLHRSPEGQHRIYVKGAPERVLAMCGTQGSGGESSLDEAFWQERIEHLASGGRRVLGIAMKDVGNDQDSLSAGDIEQGCTMLGLAGIIDPPREEAIAAVKQCNEAGIRVKMITGDFALTASAIGKQLAIGDGETVLTGQEVHEMDDAALAEAVQRVDVFARVSPEHKLELVKAVQANKQVVAMTGDGVNDAPALKRADVGVAMGITGTEVAKEAADMVLTDDNFASIAHAVEEGRTVYDNLRKAVLFILPTNGAQATVITAAILLGTDLPVTPVQILWINLVTAVTLAIALAFEPAEADIMRRAPRPPGTGLITPFFLWRIGFVSMLLAAATFGVFLWMRRQGMDLEMSRTAAINMLVLLEVVYLFNTRFILRPSFTMAGIFGNRHALYAAGTVILLQMVYTYLPLSEHLFGTAPIGPAVWGVMVLLSLVVFALVELEKYIMRRLDKGHQFSA